MIREYFLVAFKNLRKRQLRSWLTILGVVIGVFLVSGLLSLSEGMEEAIMRQLRVMGGDLVIIFPGELADLVTVFFGGMQLSDSDLEAIARASGVESVIPFSMKAELVRHFDQSKIALVAGAPLHDAYSVLAEDMGMLPTEGRWPSRGRREVLVGALFPTYIFPELHVGDQIFVKGTPFEVAGVLRSFGNRQDDSSLYMDMEIFRSVTGVREGALTALAKIMPGADADVVAENIRSELEETRKRRGGVDAPNFSVITADAVTETVGSVMAIIQFAVVAFASIAILVGAIGIMNTMYTSVFERTKEIGILKAVGAKRRDIVAIFMIEAGIIGLVGGLGGVAFGFGAAHAVELYGQLSPALYIEASASGLLAFLALMGAFFIGCASGFFPAKRAASLHPVDALRYE